ncbi:M48 family metallopeptidase [Ideonella sp. A 288]|uniref:M48 family metallopeptidase n=1 Tax=Ideonella sp. A 288 TaxID=1962181 RepID=UPI000B4BF254|nr:M48 family metallopeptidase [Ideonella sp. A 288]
MTTPFRTDAEIDLPALHGQACRCVLHARRRLGGALIGAGALAAAWPVAPAFAQQDAECKRSKIAGLAPAGQLEQAAGQQYQQMLQQANGKRALGPKDHPQVQRLRYIADRIIPFTVGCNERSRDWKWEVNLIGSQDLNAFCMPGGKIAFYYGILSKLQLSDDEVAMIMGHEVAHALLEHARERMGKTMLTRGAIELGSALLGLGDLGRSAAGMGAQLLTLQFSRSDESEADALGLVLAAKAGYDPGAGVTLWQKMGAASKGAPPQWLSTHPSGESRIQEIGARLPRVRPLFAQAPKPEQRFAPPKAAAA